LLNAAALSGAWWASSHSRRASGSVNSRRSQMSRVSQTVFTIAPGVPRVPKPLLPSFQELASKSAPNQPWPGRYAGGGLERAGVDEVMIRGQYDSCLLAGALSSPGLFHIFTTLLSVEGQNFWPVEVPLRFHGRPFGELAQVLKERYQALPVAIYTEGQALALEDLLSGEPSGIDEFIRRKFTESGMTHLFGRTKVDCQVNPADSQILGPHQYVVVIASQRPEL